MKPRHWFAIGAGALLVIGTYLGFRSNVFGSKTSYSEISGIVLFGFALTIAMFAVLAIVFSFLKLDDSRMALGLPDGSIRALLAFSLVLIFVLLATFLYGGVDKDQCVNCGKVLSGATETQINDLKGSFTVATEQARDKDGNPLFQQKAGPNGQAQDDLTQPLFNVTYYPKPNPAATDFAKQIFTTLATIFVSVVSFYFGSSVTTSAVKAAQGPGGDKSSSPLQTALNNASDDLFKAQERVDQARTKLQQAQDEVNRSPEDQAKKDALKQAQSELDAANVDLPKKQAAILHAQKALNDAKAASGATGSPSGSTPSGATN